MKQVFTWTRHRIRVLHLKFNLAGIDFPCMAGIDIPQHILAEVSTLEDLAALVRSALGIRPSIVPLPLDVPISRCVTHSQNPPIGCMFRLPNVFSIQHLLESLFPLHGRPCQLWLMLVPAGQMTSPSRTASVRSWPGRSQLRS